MATTFRPSSPFGRGASRGRIPLGRDWMRTGITSAPRAGSTGRRGEGPTPVVTRFPRRTQRRQPACSRARPAVLPSQAASTHRRLSWSPRWGWQLPPAGPSAGYRGSPRAPQEGTSDWRPRIGHVGARPTWNTPRPNDQICHTTIKGTLPSLVWDGEAHLAVRTGGVSCRRLRESSRLVLWVGPPRAVPCRLV